VYLLFYFVGLEKNESLDFNIFKIKLEAQNGLFLPYIRYERSV